MTRRTLFSLILSALGIRSAPSLPQVSSHQASQFINTSHYYVIYTRHATYDYYCLDPGSHAFIHNLSLPPSRTIADSDVPPPGRKRENIWRRAKTWESNLRLPDEGEK